MTTLSTTPKRPRKTRKASKAVQGRLVEFLFNEKIRIINESPTGEVLPSDDIFITSRTNGGYKLSTFNSDKFFEAHCEPAYTPWMGRGTLLTPCKLRPLRPDQDVEKVTWRYAVAEDFKNAGYPEPDCQESTPEQAAALLNLARNAIAAQPEANAIHIEWRGVKVVADSPGLWIDALTDTPGLRMFAFLHVEGWRPFTFKNGGKWCLPPTDAKPYGVFWVWQA